MAQAARLNLRMQKELKLLMTDPPPGVSFPLLEDGENPPSPSLSSIEARIEGPEGTVYSKGVFTVRIQIPERYPFQPPNMTFATPIYHPNIDNGGRICLDILNLPPKGAWQPSLNISTVLTSIGLLLSEPNPDDGLMAETSKEYKYNKQAFDQTARLWTEKFANAGESGRSNDGSASTVNLQPETEIIKEEALSRDAIIVAEGSRKKLRLNGDKLSLKSKTTVEMNRDNEENQAPTRKISISHSQKPFVVATSISQIRDDKENVAPIRKLSISRTHKTLVIASSTSHIGENVPNSGEQSSHCGNKQDVVSDVKQVEEGSLKNIESIIISDSEESDEDEAPPRSRFSLMRKQIVGKLQKS